jgi:hypothetical protein
MIVGRVLLCALPEPNGVPINDPVMPVVAVAEEF